MVIFMIHILGQMKSFNVKHIGKDESVCLAHMLHDAAIFTHKIPQNWAIVRVSVCNYSSTMEQMGSVPLGFVDP